MYKLKSIRRNYAILKNKERRQETVHRNVGQHVRRKKLQRRCPGFTGKVPRPPSMNNANSTAPAQWYPPEHSARPSNRPRGFAFMKECVPLGGLRRHQHRVFGTLLFVSSITHQGLTHGVPTGSRDEVQQL